MTAVIAVVVGYTQPLRRVIPITGLLPLLLPASARWPCLARDTLSLHVLRLAAVLKLQLRRRSAAAPAPSARRDITRLLARSQRSSFAHAVCIGRLADVP